MDAIFNVGDLIIYGNTGVCRITEITKRDFSGVDKDQLFYVLKPLYDGYVIYAPVDNSDVFTRPIISKEKAEQLIGMIPTINAEPFHSRIVRELTAHYQASLKTHDCKELIGLTMSIYAKKQDAETKNRKLGAVDVKFMKLAEDLLFGELAAALGIDKESVRDYITVDKEKFTS
ncbi:MAG TPA: CarD family transcriptional regulator [Bacillota bacterium]|nr:CarD family transcriptional regulator [Bacillota bacterium]